MPAEVYRRATRLFQEQTRSPVRDSLSTAALHIIMTSNPGWALRRPQDRAVPANEYRSAILTHCNTIGCASLLALAISVAAAPAQEHRTLIECPIIADTTIDERAPQARNASAGGHTTLSAANATRFTLLQFDLSALKGFGIQRATLRLRRVQDLLVRSGISTVAAGGWEEGTAENFTPQIGSACYNFRRYHPDARMATPWSELGGDFSDVVFGNGGSRWASVVPKFDKQTLWYEIEVPPALIAAIAQDLQPGGLVVSDDFGRQEVVSTFGSRESDSKPLLIVEGVHAAPHASAPPEHVRAYRDPVGREWVEFTAPRALGFDIVLSERPIGSEEDVDASAAARLPTWAMPAPGDGPRTALISLHRTAQHRYASVRAIEANGEWSSYVSAELPAPAPAAPVFAAPALQRFDLPKTIDAPLVIDDGPALSRDARWIRSDEKTWWDPLKGPVTLQSARNEFIAFQVILAGGPGLYAVSTADWTSPGAAQPAPRVQLFREHYVKARVGREKYAPEIAVPLAPGELIPLGPTLVVDPTAEPTSAPAPTANVQAIWIEIYIPHRVAPGVWRNRVIAVRDGRAVLDIPLELDVLDATLPDALSFHVGLKSVETPAQVQAVPEESEQAWTLLNADYRLAHEHRATLTIVPYQSAGRIPAGFAPAVRGIDDGLELEWSEWDRRFTPYFDGSAFRGLPRDGVPLDHFILPFCEFWPAPFEFQRGREGMPLAQRYHYLTTWTEARTGSRSNPRADSYMIRPLEDAFGRRYIDVNTAALRQAAAHIAERGWNRTEFHLLLNNVLSSSPKAVNWFQFREPKIFDDFLALRFWMGMYRSALPGSSGPIRIRDELDQPEFERGVLAGLADITALGSALFEKNRLLIGAPTRFGQPWWMLDEVEPELGWSSVLKWGWSARLAGARGLVTRAALGHDRDWDSAASGAFIYPWAAESAALRSPWGAPGSPLGARPSSTSPAPVERTASSAPAGPAGEPCASLRLKALRRVQQDAELLELWMAPHRAVGVPEGYLLASIGFDMAERAAARGRPGPMFLPVIEFPGRLDTVAFEETRRALRAAVSSR
jgi:hypothetical protein